MPEVTRKEFEEAWAHILARYRSASVNRHGDKLLVDWPKFSGSNKLRGPLRVLGIRSGDVRGFIEQGKTPREMADLILDIQRQVREDDPEIAARRERLGALINERSRTNSGIPRRPLEHLRGTEEGILNRRRERNLALQEELERRRLEETRREEEELLKATDISVTSAVFREDLPALRRLSRQIVQERVKLGILQRSQSEIAELNYAAFWRKAVAASSRQNAQGKAGMNNFLMVRLNDEKKTPIGFIKFGNSKNEDGQLVMHIEDTYVLPPYRASSGDPRLPKIIPHLIYNAFKALREAQDGVSAKISYITYDPKKFGYTGTRDDGSLVERWEIPTEWSAEDPARKRGVAMPILTPTKFFHDDPAPVIRTMVRAFPVRPTVRKGGAVNLGQYSTGPPQLPRTSSKRTGSKKGGGRGGRK